MVAWPEPVIEALGHDPRSQYVELFWLGVIGPTATWLMRRLAAGFDAQPEGFDLDLCETARTLGVGAGGGLNSPFRRAITRCVTFELACQPDTGVLAVRRKMPPLPRRLLVRLPASLQEHHSRWSEAQLRAGPGSRRNTLVAHR